MHLYCLPLETGMVVAGEYSERPRGVATAKEMFTTLLAKSSRFSLSSRCKRKLNGLKMPVHYITSGLSSLTHCTCDTRNWLLSHAHTQTRITLTHFCSCLEPGYGQQFYKYQRPSNQIPCVLGHYLLYNGSSTTRCGPTSVTVQALLIPLAPKCVW